MLTIYKPPRKKGDSSDSDSSTIIIPAGRPYLTKVKGKLVMAREKRDKTADIVLDLLGEAFGTNKPKLIHRSRATSLEPPAQRLLIGEVPYAPQQQLTYSTPIPQQPFPQFLPHHPSGVAPVQPQYPAQLQYPVQPPTYIIPHPSERDLEQLRLISTHFETMHGKSSTIPGSNKKEETTKTTVTITKHVCAQCGQLRSRKYHHDNPIQLGETPRLAYCRKCQKDASSTSGGDSDWDSKKFKNKKANKKRKNKGKGKTSKQAVEISHDGDNNECKGNESEQSPATKKPKDFKSSKENAAGYKCVPTEDYIIVEEEYSDEEQRLRGRGRTKAQERGTIEEYVDQRPLSHLGSQLTTRNRSPSRSTTKGQRFELPREQVGTSKINEPIQSSLPPIQYRYVERAPSHNFVEVYPKKVPINFVEEEEFYNSKPKEAAPREEVRYPKPSYLGEEYTVEIIEELEPVGAVSSKDHHRFQVIDTNSRHKSQNPKRRKQQRGDGESFKNHNRKTWHEIHPQYYDEVIVGGERHNYGHQDHRDYEEERRVQERLDRDMLNVRSGSRELHDVHVKYDSKHLKEDSAYRYYHDDWSRVEPEIISNRRGYRRDRRQDSNFSDSEASLLYDKNGAYNPQYPQVPSPPSAISAHRPVQPPYPINSDSEAQNVRSRSRSPTGNRNSSGEQSIVLSPRGYADRSYGYDESEISGLSLWTENERAVEEETRKRVTFRNTPSERSFSEVDSEWRIEDPQDAEPIIFPSETGFADGDAANSWVEGGTNLW